MAPVKANITDYDLYRLKLRNPFWEGFVLFFGYALIINSKLKFIIKDSNNNSKGND